LQSAIQLLWRRSMNEIKKTGLFVGIDYELVPFKDDEEHWAVRLLTGPFPETVVAFNTISFNEIQEHISFNFGIVQSPDPDLLPENEELQYHCGLILESIIEDGLEQGFAQLKEKKK